MTASPYGRLAHPSNADVQKYWDERVDDTRLSTDAPGTPGYFAAMAAYRYAKHGYLPGLIGFEKWAGRDVLDVGCGAGIDLVHLARAGARATGVELSLRSLELARRYLGVASLDARLVQADGARLPFEEGSFDLVLCHGVLPFASDPAGIVSECRRVLRPAGLALFVAYNRHSWMGALRALSIVAPGHGDAPNFRLHTHRELDRLLAPFPGRALRTARRGWHLVAQCSLHSQMARADIDDA
jgi:SAM-dependent methyltransferase